MISSLYKGQVFHRRLRPKKHALRYRVFSLLLSLDEIDSLDKQLWLFSRNRWNVFSFYDKDFGERLIDRSAEGTEAVKAKTVDTADRTAIKQNNAILHEESLQEYVCRQLRENGIQQEPACIKLSCYPRVFGYAFNPLSLFYCFDNAGRVFAVLHEVHNTFGERHTYTLGVSEELTDSTESESDRKQVQNSDSEAGSEWIHQRASKALFVSPFAHMNMHYRFRLNEPGERQVIVIHAHDEQGHLLTASYAAERSPLTSTNLLKCLVSMPAMTLKVIVGIHWEALQLWIKRVPWFSHQNKQTFIEKQTHNT